ncbi:hypothetical protein DASB73_025860 [Starmerella bacillaris]|uniref:Uncharacterized protein n=1 Tax=Starmerella bacillaris TaxID=1247836 RepID=A0AAV5RKD9_STABA|nr:hypothetical protein DASB73_025860 [Starmerella bacillaris]
MFGFPENISDWGPSNYLRLFTFIAVYISLRPLIQAFYNKLGERGRKRQAKLEEDRLIKENKLQRVRELVGSGNDNDDDTSDSEVEEAVTTAVKKTPVVKRSKPLSRKEAILADMPSDDDIEDLLH